VEKSLGRKLDKMDKREKSKIEKLFEDRGGRERRDSIGCIEEMLKRKREEMDKNWEKEEMQKKQHNGSPEKREIVGPREMDKRNWRKSR